MTVFHSWLKKKKVVLIHSFSLFVSSTNLPTMPEVSQSKRYKTLTLAASFPFSYDL